MPAFTDFPPRTLKSPQILELSGIGDPSVLSSIGVPVAVNLPGVGDNVQDHLLYALSYGTYVSDALSDAFRADCLHSRVERRSGL